MWTIQISFMKLYIKYLKISALKFLYIISANT